MWGGFFDPRKKLANLQQTGCITGREVGKAGLKIS